MKCCRRDAQHCHLQITVGRSALACWLAHELVLVRRAWASASLLSAASLAMCASCTSLALPSCRSISSLRSDRGRRASLSDLMRLTAYRGVRYLSLALRHTPAGALLRQGGDSKGAVVNQHVIGIVGRFVLVTTQEEIEVWLQIRARLGPRGAASLSHCKRTVCLEA